MADNPIVCLLEEIKAGRLDEKQGKKIIKRIEQLKNDSLSETEAADIVMSNFQKEIQADYISMKLTNDSVDSFMRQVDVDPITKDNVKLRITEYIGESYRFHRESLKQLPISVLQRAMIKNKASLDSLNTADMENITKILFTGEKSTDARLNGTAKALKEAYEVQRDNMRQAGVIISDLADNQFPVNVSPGKVVEVSEDDFLKDAIKSLDLDFLRKNIPFLHEIEGGMEEFISLVHRVSKGGSASYVNEFKNKGYSFSPADLLGTFRSNAVVSNEQAFTLMSKKYGTGKPNLINELIHNLDSNSDYLARRFAFGNADAYINTMKAKIEEKGLLSGSVKEYLNNHSDYVKGNNDYFGFLEDSVDFNFMGRKIFSLKPAKVLGMFQGLSSIKTATGGFLGAFFNDPAVSASALRTLGFKNKNQYVEAFKSVMDFTRFSSKSPEELTALGFNIRQTIDEFTEITRYLNEGVESKLGAGLTRFVSKVSGVERITAANRRRMLATVGTEIAALRNIKWEDLNPSFKRYMSIVNISPKEWAEIAATKWEEYGGVPIASPITLSRQKKPILAQKLNAFYLLAQEKGVPTGSVALEVAVKKYSKGASPLAIALIQSAKSFKGPIASIWEHHMRPAFAAGRDKDVYANMLILTTLFGAAQLTIEELLKKNQSPDHSRAGFWAESFVKGGGASIFGDAVPMMWRDWQTADRFVSSTVLGVTMGSYVDVGQSLYRGAKKALGNNDTTLAYDLYKVLDGYNPAATLWYTRGLWDRYASQKIRKALAPKKEIRKRRRELRRMREEGASKVF